MIRREHLLTVPLVMLIIVAIDFGLGATAEHLNAYEILRRTFHLPLEAVSEQWVIGQAWFGSWALLWAWLVWIVEAIAATALLWGVASLVCRVMELPCRN